MTEAQLKRIEEKWSKRAYRHALSAYGEEDHAEDVLRLIGVLREARANLKDEIYEKHHMCEDCEQDG